MQWLKRLVKAEKSTFTIARRNLLTDEKSNSIGKEFQAFVTRSLKKCDLASTSYGALLVKFMRVSTRCGMGVKLEKGIHINVN